MQESETRGTRRPQRGGKKPGIPPLQHRAREAPGRGSAPDATAQDPCPLCPLSTAFCVTSRRPLPELPRPRPWRLCLDFLCSLHTLDQGFPIPLLDLVPSSPRRSLLELCLSPPGASPVPSLPSPGFPVSPPRPAPVFKPGAESAGR